MTAAKTPALAFSPVPALQEAAAQILAAFPDATLYPAHAPGNAEIIRFGGDAAQAALADSIYTDILDAYTGQHLTPAVVKAAIEKHIRPDAASGPQGKEAVIAIPRNLAAEQRTALDSAIDFLQERENLTLRREKAEIALEGKTRQAFLAGYNTISSVIGRLQKGEAPSRNAIRAIYAEEYKILSNANKKPGKKERIIGHRTDILTEIDGQEVISLALELKQKASRQAADAIANSKLFAAVTPVETQDGGTALAVSTPLFEHAKTQDKEESLRTHAHTVIRRLAQMLEAGNLQHLGRHNVEQAMQETFSPPRAPSAAPCQDVAAERPQVTDIVLTNLGGRPTAEFAGNWNAIKKRAALEALADSKLTAVRVTVENGPGESGPALKLSFNTAAAPLDQEKLRKVESVLLQMLEKWNKKQKVDASTVHTMIGAAFESVARTRQQPAISTNSNVEQALASGRNSASAPALFDLAPWQEDENGSYFSHRSLSGELVRFYPTANQRDYIRAIRDPDVKAIMLQAPTGAGKTFWAVRMALELLQAGIIRRIAYERPPVTTGGNRYNPYLPGSAAEKYGPFGAVLEKELAKHLGMGDVDNGYRLLSDLKKEGLVYRYDQSYKRGDTIEDEIVIGDEMQNKDSGEIFHLLTRPGRGAKIILIGDGEFQTDLTNNRSGFLQAHAMFSDKKMIACACRNLAAMGIEVAPSSIVALTFGAEDIRRSPHTALVYELFRMQKEEQRPHAAHNPALEKYRPS